MAWKCNFDIENHKQQTCFTAGQTYIEHDDRGENNAVCLLNDLGYKSYFSESTMLALFTEISNPPNN